MSRRLSTSQSNTLFNYFQSPKGKPSPKSPATPSSKHNLSSSNEDINNDEDKSETSKKRSRLAIVDSGSDTENSPIPKATKKAKVRETSEDSSLERSKNGNKKEKSSKKAAKRRRIITDNSDSDHSPESSSDTDESSNTAKNVARKSLQSFSFTHDKSSTSKENSKEVTPAKQKTTNSQESSLSIDGEDWLHNRLDFLRPERIRDADERRPNDPYYDPRTLFVPDDYLNKLTPAMRQWWILKSHHFDSVLFFKVGKFYELYHMDAVVGVNHLGFSYMKGEFAHSGFPEIAYGKMASSLLEQGFKVARVEQTETPEMMAERCKKQKKSTKFDKVVAREICQITTKATCVYGAQLTEAKQALPCYMLALVEKPLVNGTRFGICLVDTSTGLFHLGDFNDDKQYSRLLTLLAEYPVGLLLIERGNLQTSTNELIQNTLTNIKKDVLASKKQFFNAQDTLDILMQSCYFRDKDDKFNWPAGLKDLIEDGSAKQQYELAIHALGGCLWYLKDSEIDIQVFSMRKFEIYQPIDVTSQKQVSKRDYMVLDAVTIRNLNLLGSGCTLQKTLDHCKTAFGKRLLQQWICRPSCVEQKIMERQRAVQELYENSEVLKDAREILKKMPDLERQVAKINTFGNRYCATDHPDSRAVLYGAHEYSKRKIRDLISTLIAFEEAQSLNKTFKDCQSSLLKKLTCYPPEGIFPDLTETLEFFKGAFDHKKAEKEGHIIPIKGVDLDYDEADKAIDHIKQEAQEYLAKQEKFFGCTIKYFGTDKKRYQLEVPTNKTHKVTVEYQLEGTRKGYKRYTTPTTQKILQDTLKAEAKKNKILQDSNRRVYEKFSERRNEWEQSIQCLMMLDVICAFAAYGSTNTRDVCFPKILPFQSQPVINIESGVHPCTPLQDFVPNNTQLGTEDAAKIMVLTGPNMGGKSTLMRQVATIVVMAQMGCMIPAVSCEISLVDRIFTRIGAYDDILRGQSTFLVELSEASLILQHATVNSLVLVDELGRGTSTYDGTAIAMAYVDKLTEYQCRTIFSTHYHTLVETFTNRRDIQLAHMACMTDEDEQGVDEALKTVVLLYTLRTGNCPKSHGFNAAKLAGLPNSVILRAYDIAGELERVTKVRNDFSNLMTSPSTSRNLVALLQQI